MKFYAVLVASLALGFGYGDEVRAPKNFEYRAKDFSALYGMEGFDKELIALHLKLYEGYVLNTNQLLNQLQDSDAQGMVYGALKRRVAFEYDGMRLHELYFENLAGNGVLDTDSPLYEEIEKNFGTFDHFKIDFIGTGMMRGPGWAILYREPQNNRLINVWISEHGDGHIAGGTPVLVMDVWEHAYITQFKLDKKKYIELFFKNINWDVVAGRG